MHGSQQKLKNGLEILHLTNTHSDFYRLLGPFLSRREICKELGSPVWDEDCKVWTIALDSKGDVAGFVAHIQKAKAVYFCSDFVLPEKRKNGIYSMLMRERMALMPSRVHLKAMATDMSVHEYLKQGFIDKGKRGRFHIVELLR